MSPLPPTHAPPRKVLVIGAGVSGLACAHRLLRLGVDCVVLEASDRVGGKVSTVRDGEIIFEAGPNTMLLNKQPTLDLIGELGLHHLLVYAAPTGKNRWIWHNHRLNRLPAGPISACFSPLLGPVGLWQVLGDLRWKRPVDAPEAETVASFITRRFGPKVLRTLVEPFLAGVYAGDVEQMEAVSVLPELVEAEKAADSVIRGLFRKRSAMQKAGRPRLSLISATFAEGLAALPQAMATELGSRVRLRAEVERLAIQDQAVTATLADGSRLTGEHVVLAVEPSAAAKLVAEMPAGDVAANQLAQIQSVRLAVVEMVFPRSAVKHKLNGFGFLVTRPSELNILGCIFRSSIFPLGMPPDQVLLVCFVGGAHRPELVDWNDAALSAMVRSDLERTVGATGEPICTYIRRWPAAIPHQTVGHHVIKAALGLWSQDKPVSFIGPYLGGVSLNDCIAYARQTAEKLAQSLIQS